MKCIYNWPDNLPSIIMRIKRIVVNATGIWGVEVYGATSAATFIYDAVVWHPDETTTRASSAKSCCRPARWHQHIARSDTTIQYAYNCRNKPKRPSGFPQCHSTHTRWLLDENNTNTYWLYRKLLFWNSPPEAPICDCQQKQNWILLNRKPQRYLTGSCRKIAKLECGTLLRDNNAPSSTKENRETSTGKTIQIRIEAWLSCEFETLFNEAKGLQLRIPKVLKTQNPDAMKNIGIQMSSGKISNALRCLDGSHKVNVL